MSFKPNWARLCVTDKRSSGSTELFFTEKFRSCEKKKNLLVNPNSAKLAR